MALVISGRVGWVAKAIIYAIIGGVCCQVAVQGHALQSGAASPQVDKPKLQEELLQCQCGNYSRGNNGVLKNMLRLQTGKEPKGRG